MGIFLLKLVARLPFWWLYLLSRVLYVIIYHLAGYRKKVVIENLKKAFPEKPEKELKEIRRQFYRHFSDLTLEVIKMGHMSEAEFRKRMAVKNAELLHHYFEQKKSLVALTMHFNNWEWSSALALHLKHTSLGVYKPLHNRKYDDYINKNRSRMGAEMIPNNLVLRRVIKARKKNEPFFLWLAGDQTPPFFYKFWLTFFNQEALFYPGPAAISRRFNYPVIFQKIIKKEKGLYETSFEVLFENPKDFTEAQIMKAYIRKMEETIKEQPGHYLWSHKRWKHKRPQEVPMMD